MKHLYRSAILCLALFCFSFLPALGQANLVLNGSFEIHDTCPYDFDAVRFARYWDALDTNYSYYHDIYSGTYLSTCHCDPFPDYANTCATSVMTIPAGGIFSIPAHR